MWRETLPLLRAKRILKKKQTKSRSEVNDSDATEAKFTDNNTTTSVQQNQRTTKRVRRLLSMECLEEDNVTPSTPFPTDTASSTFPTIAAPSPLCSPIISAAPSIPPQDQLLLHYLREHLNEFTSNVDISASHRFNVLEHIACPNPSRPQQSHKKRCRMLMLQPTVNAKTEQLFQKLLVSSIASLVFPQSLPPPANDGSSFVAAAAESLPRVVQVHNTVREFVMDCNTCAVRGFDHRFVVNGTVGDIHVVTPPPPPQKSANDGRTTGMQHHHSSSRHQEDKHVREFATSSADCDMSHPSSSSPPPSLPADTAIVLEVKNSHALNHKMLAQALLEMELQKQLMCCQGRTYGPDDDNLSQAALLKRPLSNCPCTEAADTVLILWGSESCVITSSNRKTGERNIKKEDQIVMWVKAVHARLGERAEALLSRRAGNSRSSVLLGPPELDSYNILHHVRPLPRVNWAMQCGDGSVLGSVSFEVLSLHPSISLPFGAADGMVGRGDRSIVTTTTSTTSTSTSATRPPTTLPVSSYDSISVSPPPEEVSASVNDAAADSKELGAEDPVNDSNDVSADDEPFSSENIEGVEVIQDAKGAGLVVATTAVSKRQAKSKVTAAVKQRASISAAVRRRRGGTTAAVPSAGGTTHRQIRIVSVVDVLRTSKRRYSTCCCWCAPSVPLRDLPLMTSRWNSWRRVRFVPPASTTLRLKQNFLKTAAFVKQPWSLVRNLFV